MNSKSVQWCADYLEEHGGGKNYDEAVKELRRCASMFQKYEGKEPEPPKSKLIPESKA